MFSVGSSISRGLLLDVGIVGLQIVHFIGPEKTNGNMFRPGTNRRQVFFLHFFLIPISSFVDVW